MAETHPIPTNPRFKDRTGLRYGRLTVLAYAGERCWLCRCDCGLELTVKGNNLTSRNTRSCGCLQAEMTREASRTHGLTYSGEYNSWCGMISRCSNPRNNSHYVYGARGVAVCARWRDSFEAFFADMGRRPTPCHSIERLDNDVDYQPGNCVWATDKEQSRNKRNNHRLTFRGETLCIADWSDRTGLKQRTIYSRLKIGWSVERALTTPVLKMGSWRRKP
jgi:hypothetical protein